MSSQYQSKLPKAHNYDYVLISSHSSNNKQLQLQLLGLVL